MFDGNKFRPIDADIAKYGGGNPSKSLLALSGVAHVVADDIEYDVAFRESKFFLESSSAQLNYRFCMIALSRSILWHQL